MALSDDGSEVCVAVYSGRFDQGSTPHSASCVVVVVASYSKMPITVCGYYLIISNFDDIYLKVSSRL
jgi:hypothetical protein